MENKRLKKIVVIGPESTGKSTLCEQLALYYHTIWVKEYAREYLITNGKEYTYENLMEIANGQLAAEDLCSQKAILNKKSNLFIDTDMYVMKVWSEFVFNKCDNHILNQIVQRKYDLYLLCNIDLPWVKDELREYPDLITREKLYKHYKELMINQQTPWIDISGDYNERLKKAIAGVDAL